MFGTAHLISVLYDQLSLMLDDVEVFMIADRTGNKVIATSRNVIARIQLTDVELCNRLADAGGCFSLAWDLLVMLKDGGIDKEQLEYELPTISLRKRK